MKVIVDRLTWLRGEGGGHSVLFRPDDGKKCCLGFACEQDGVPLTELTGVATPSTLVSRKMAVDGDEQVSLPDILYILVNDDISDLSNSIACINMMETNDATVIDDATREFRLTEHGASVGIEFEFIN